MSALFPFLPLIFLRLGYSTAAIGGVGCLRPLVSFPAGSLGSGAADHTRRHRAVLLAAFAASLALRLAIAAAGRAGFGVLLATVVAMEAAAAPVTILVDSGPSRGEAAVLAWACVPGLPRAAGCCCCR